MHDPYDYYEAVRYDVMDYIRENLNSNDWQNKEEELDSYLNNVLWTEDSVTGNGSGSYWFSTWEAEEALCHNLDLLKEALDEWGIRPDLSNPEALDVTIRCHLLSDVIWEVLNESYMQAWLHTPCVVNPAWVAIPVNVAVQLMDDDLREKLHRELAPCGEQAFFDAYCKAHEEKFNEVWELTKPNPCY